MSNTGTAQPRGAANENKVVARWQGTIQGRHRQYATREPGGFGALLSGPNSVETISVKVALREERVGNTGKHRTVVESIDWSSSLGDLYYQNSDGSTVPAGKGGSKQVTFTEEELTRGPAAADAERLQQLQNQVDEARAEVDQAEQKKQAVVQKLLHARKPERAIPGSGEFDAALNKLRAASVQHGAQDEKTDAAYRSVTDALSKIQSAMTSDLERQSQDWQRDLAAPTAVLSNPNASEADKRAASGAIQAYSDKIKEAADAYSSTYEGFTSRYDLVSADADLAMAQKQLRDAEQQLADAKAERTVGASADAGVRVEPGTGKRVAYVQFALNETHKLDFPIEVLTLELANIRGMDIRTQPSEPVTHQPRIPLLGLGFKGEAEAKPGGATIIYQKSQKTGSPGLIGGGEDDVSVTFTRTPEPVRYDASVASVSEIPAYSLPALDMLGVQVGEGVWGRWSAKWIDEYRGRTGENPLDAAFSDSQHFRFMNVLSAYIETPDGVTITQGECLPTGPHGEYINAGKSALIIVPVTAPPPYPPIVPVPIPFGDREFKTLGSSMKITVDGVEVMIFEQVYGAQTRAPELSTTVPGNWFPPIWTSLRLAIAADGRTAMEMFDYSYFPQHFVFENGAYRDETIEDPVTWGSYGWDKLEEGPNYFMFDPAGAEEWWRMKARVTWLPYAKGSMKGNPWAIKSGSPIWDRSPAVDH